MSSNLPEALEVYRAAWLLLAKKEILIEETDVQETSLGFIGPGNRRLTKVKHFSDRLARFNYMHCIMICLEEFI